ncbi:RNA polymerase sigma factor [Streptomyces justiciae]|uniref:RNA polymerase sigma factor n=1 Tax=Streptomyces justiciae TaxID=2780140 RepID=UPI001881A9F2|nr:sigma-70 family RNA polymerase sigma factor [Streptomyces justiciae]MBE8478383.1 sigma-70 family RNA polymerase sigma factor [Streptomyces justiciae]
MTSAERFHHVYEECYPRVLAYAISLVGRQVGEDITSETFTIAWRRIHDDVPHPSLPWLLGVARNLAREMRRRDALRYLVAAEEAQRIVGGARDEAGDVAAVIADRHIALQALASLPESDRELLTLIAWHGLSTKEAAQVLKCTGAALAVRLYRARRRLEKALETAQEPDPSEAAPARAAGTPRPHREGAPA